MNQKVFQKKHHERLDKMLKEFAETCHHNLDRSFLTGAFDPEDPEVNPDLYGLARAILVITVKEVDIFPPGKFRALYINLSKFI